jgi:hypothetical protein
MINQKLEESADLSSSKILSWSTVTFHSVSLILQSGTGGMAQVAERLYSKHYEFKPQNNQKRKKLQSSGAKANFHSTPV